MYRYSLFTVLFLTVLAGGTAGAQNLCPPGVPSDKMICLIPQIYGPNGLVTGGGVNYPSGASSKLDFASGSLRPVNTAIVSQAASLPFASPSSGITFAWDPAAKVFAPSAGSLGPIVGDRAETIGRGKVFVGFDYQYFQFGTFDGVSLKDLPVVFTQPDNSVAVPPQTCSLNGFVTDTVNTGPCAFIRDVITVKNRLDLKVSQFITVVNFGVLNRLDVSMVIPMETVRMGISSNATVVNNSNSPFHFFDRRPGCGSLGPPPVSCMNQQFSNVRTASGIGDMIMRVKGTAWKGERAALALGADIRFPTGDAMNYLGSGAAGVQPFLTWSRNGRISPHALVGYQVNGSSVIAGDIITGSKERLPSQLTYSGGADVWLTKRITVAADLVGEQVFQARRLSKTTLTEMGGCTQVYPACAAPFAPANVDPALSASTRSVNISSVSLGAKWKPLSTVLITSNVLIRVNDGGLHAGVVPLVGVSYTF
jgi:hypothetical protein